MPSLNHNVFISRLKGKPIDLAELHRAYPALGTGAIAGSGLIEGTTENLEKLWEAIDRFDHDGNVNDIRAPALSIAQCCLKPGTRMERVVPVD
jgi:hypothetical protein